MKYQLKFMFALLIVGSMIAPVGASGWRASAAGAERPNVIMLVTDDLDADSIRFMPNVEALLATNGATFSHYFVSTPLCCPSRVSMLRGQYAHNHGVLGNHGPDGGFGAFYRSDGEQSTLATWLQADGYRTALIGKYLNGYTQRDIGPTYVPPGWSEWYAGANHSTYDEFSYRLNENGVLVDYGGQPEDYLTDVLAGKANDVVARASDAGEPFFLYLAPYAPHSPSTPAPRHATAFAREQAPRSRAYDEKDVRDKPEWVRQTPRLTPAQRTKIDDHYRDRLRSLLAVDEMVASLVDTLAATGELDHTYIFFTSDNGIHQGEHRQPHGKQSPYDEVIRVPLIVWGPGVDAGRTIDALTLNIDLAPTIADLTGVRVPGFVDGHSLAPLLFGRDPGSRQAVLIEDLGSDRRAEEKGVEGPPVPSFRAMRGAGLVYVEYVTGERELYDLTQDPAELKNLAERADRKTLHMLSERLAWLSACAAADCRQAEDAPLPALEIARKGPGKHHKRADRRHSSRDRGK